MDLIDYRVTMWPRHGAVHNLFIEAPDAFTAQQYAMRMCPNEKVVSILPIQDLRTR